MWGRHTSSVLSYTSSSVLDIYYIHIAHTYIQVFSFRNKQGKFLFLMFSMNSILHKFVHGYLTWQY